MLNITLLCVGKLKEEYWRMACGEYAKRLKAFCKISVEEVEEWRLGDHPSPAQIALCLAEEGKRLAAKIPAGAYIIAMCIEGKMMSSPELSQLIQQTAIGGKSNLVFLIGGSYGLWEQVKEKADVRLSMSRMTFPHQMARPMLLEQVYRAFQISSNGKYHK